MKSHFLRALVIAPLAAIMLLQPSAGSHRVGATDGDLNDLNWIQQKLLSGFAAYEFNANGDATGSQQPTSYFPRGSDDCPVNISSNIKINQNCLNLSDPALAGRGQSQNETGIAQDPNNPNHLIASYNDYRRGDGNCYTAYSTDKGRTWNDSTVPMSFTNRAQTSQLQAGSNNFPGAREYWQAGGDTSVAWDTEGNAYLMCQVFNRGLGPTSSPDTSSALLVFRSTINDGASWNFPGRYSSVAPDVTGSDGNIILLDKPYMTVDNHVGSPFQDRVYVAWTQFATDGTAYILESYSTDHGETFSPAHVASIDSPLCTQNYAQFGVGTPEGNCNENQFSQPFTGPDGALYIVYANFNNTPAGQDNRNQMLLVKSTDGGNTFTAPVKVSDYYDLPDCATYQNGQDFGRACVPEKSGTSNSIFRAVNYPSGVVNPNNPQQVVVTFGSYINIHSNESNGCVPAGTSPATGQDLYTGVKTPGACNDDILESVSNDGGLTFTGTTTDPRALTTVTQDPGQATTDQFWQWITFTKTGKLAVSYYDRQYGTDETTGYSDVSLSGSGDLTNFVVQRVTSSSMPPPTQFGGLFYGDYTGLTGIDNAYPVWMDTRDPELFYCPAATSSSPAVCTAQYSDGSVPNDQDIFTAALPVPSK